MSEKNHENTEHERMRRVIVGLTNEIRLLKQMLHEESKAKYEAYRRISELTRQD